MKMLLTASSLRYVQNKFSARKDKSAVVVVRSVCRELINGALADSSVNMGLVAGSDWRQRMDN